MNNKDYYNLESKLNEIKSYFENANDEFDFELLNQEYGINIKELEDDMKNSIQKIDLPYKKLNQNAVNPFYNYEGDSGFDLYSTEEITIEPFGRALIPTGLSFDIKDGYEIQVRTKSGLAINQGLMVLNSPGTVDSGYLGEIKVIIFNTNQTPFTIQKGMKVAQAVLCPVVNGKWVELVEKEVLSNKDRGDNGFGSTGI